MGFHQYHEPPEELSAATRTFARMITSLTEEAEAIGCMSSAYLSKKIKMPKKLWKMHSRKK